MKPTLSIALITLGLTFPAPAIAHSNAELWRQWESQIDSIDARVEVVGLKSGMTLDPIHRAIRGRRQRFGSCMRSNRNADCVTAVLACQIEPEVES